MIDSLNSLKSSKYCFGVGAVVWDWLHYKHCLVGSIEDISESLVDLPHDRNCSVFYLIVFNDSLDINGVFKAHELKTFARVYSSLRPGLELWTLYECFMQSKAKNVNSEEREKVLKQSLDLCQRISMNLQLSVLAITLDLQYLQMKVNYRFKTQRRENWLDNALDLAKAACTEPRKFAMAKNILLVTETTGK